MACDHHVIAITNRLRFQEAGELEYVGLNVLVAAKHGKAPHPIDHDTHYADGDGNVQDQRQGVHRFSAAAKADHTWQVPEKSIEGGGPSGETSEDLCYDCA